jgi:AcrR family transcriptional regulator
MSSRKTELLDAALHYLLKHGVADASLRPIAAEIGTSARMLMFHFKSKEGLLQEVMQALHARLQGSLVALAQPRPSAKRVAPLRLFWNWATRPENLPYLRLLQEVKVIAMQNPQQFGPYLKKASGDWHDIALQSMSDSLKSSSLATLCIAVFDGLLLELMAGGDHRRLTRAVDEFIHMVREYGAAR